MGPRGALIVFEGCDKAGKSTHVKLLVSSLTELGKRVTSIAFPERTTTIGQIIDKYLKCKTELQPESAHLLFSANRWELMPKIEKSLQDGESVILDRYAFSGAAFSGAKGLDLNWCKSADIGLPRPDAVIFLDIGGEAAAGRGDFGDERYENVDFQQEVRKRFFELKDDTWQIVQTHRSISEVQKDILQLTVNIITQCEDQPIGKLWTLDRGGWTKTLAPPTSEVV